MKKRFLLPLITISAVCLKANGQDDSTRPMFGLKAAFDINIPGDWHTANGSVDMYKIGYGGTIGGVYNVYLGRGFYLEPGVSLFYDSYSYKDLTIADSDYNGPNLLKAKVNKFGFRIPVVAGYTFGNENFSLSVYTGPELSYAFAGKISYDIPFDEGMPTGLFDNQRRVDCSWKIGLGYPVNNFLISWEAAIGMTDLMKNPLISFRENRVTIGLTYYL